MFRIGNAVKDYSPLKTPKIYYDVLKDNIDSENGSKTSDAKSPMIQLVEPGGVQVYE